MTTNRKSARLSQSGCPDNMAFYGDGLDVCLEVGGFLVGLVWVVSAVSSLLVEFVPITIRITGRNAKPWKSP